MSSFWRLIDALFTAPFFVAGFVIESCYVAFIAGRRLYRYLLVPR